MERASFISDQHSLHSILRKSYPRIVPAWRSASNAAAMAKASGLTSVTAFKIPLTSSILPRYAYRDVNKFSNATFVE